MMCAREECVCLRAPNGTATKQLWCSTSRPARARSHIEWVPACAQFQPHTRRGVVDCPAIAHLNDQHEQPPSPTDK